MSGLYYKDEFVEIWHGDARELVPQLKFDVIITDPPYGINHPTDYAARGRNNLAACTNYDPVYDDNKAFDPAFLLSCNMPTVLWGGNYYADKLPISSGWLVWDKMRPDDLDQSTCELAWTNFVKGVRRFRYLWHGAMRHGNEDLYHPTQKPVALSRWIMGLRWMPAGVVLDAYMGAGGTLRAAKDLGRKAIGVELSEAYCEIAARRCNEAQPSMYHLLESSERQGGLLDE
jgi:DNA modification methylase